MAASSSLNLWKSAKYEHVYLHAYEYVAEAKLTVGRVLQALSSPKQKQLLSASYLCH